MNGISGLSFARLRESRVKHAFRCVFSGENRSRRWNGANRISLDDAGVIARTMAGEIMGTAEPSEIPAVAGGTAERLGGTGMFSEEFKAQRLKRGWTEPELAKRAEEYPAWFESVVVPFEARAAHINGFVLGTFPGLLQTEDYARELIGATRQDATDQEVQRLVAVRMGRQGIFENPAPPLVWWVIDEGAFRRVVGGTDVMSAQVDRLIAVACVEVASAGAVLVRDTTDRAGITLSVPASAWRAFISEVRES
jgi:hypothetical protein